MVNTSVPFELLISTMYREDISFLNAMFPRGDHSICNILIVNQTDSDRHIKNVPDHIRVINTQERGLPQSRNMAIKNAIGKICLVADDDVVYTQDFVAIILSAFAKAKKATVITFQMEDDRGNLYRKYPTIRQHSKKTIATVNGVVIAFDREKLIAQDIWYNNHFGLGATFQTANEYVFMGNVLEGGAVALFEPKVILSHPDESSGRDQGSDRVVYGRAALKYKEYGVFAYLWLLKYVRFLVKQGYISSTDFKAKWKVGVSGIKKYKSLLKQEL